MRRNEMFIKVEVTCPICQEKRLLNKSSLDKETLQAGLPYLKIDKKCKFKERLMSESAKGKISKTNFGRKLSQEDCERKSKYMKEHPELWQGKIRGEGDTFTHSEETKLKIGNSVRKDKNES